MGRPLSLPKPLPEAEALRQLLSYDPVTGLLTWKVRTPDQFTSTEERSAKRTCSHWNTTFAGKTAGSRRKDGYIMLTIAGDAHMAHRVIWKIETGEDPEYIDHINRSRDDNRWENLRNAPHAVNMKNKNVYSSSKTGVSGVIYHERDKVWVVRVSLCGKQVQIGSYKELSHAIAARMGAQFVQDYLEQGASYRSKLNA